MVDSAAALDIGTRLAIRVSMCCVCRFLVFHSEQRDNPFCCDFHWEHLFDYFMICRFEWIIYEMECGLLEPIV